MYFLARPEPYMEVPPETSLRHAQRSEMARWRENEKTALDLLQVAGELRFDRGIDLTLFRRPIYDTRPSEVLRAHERAADYSKRVVDIDLTLSIAYAVAQLDGLPACKIDLGRLATEWLARSDHFDNIDAFVGHALAGLTAAGRAAHHASGYADATAAANGVALARRGSAADPAGDDIGGGEEGRDVVLYGFGRIGRMLARLLVEQTGRGSQLCLRAIVLRAKLDDRHLELTKRLALLRHDSTHGPFPGLTRVAPDGSALYLNGNHVAVIFADHPGEIDYADYGIHDALLIDNTGAWRDRAGLEQHLRPGIRSVLLTAPAEEVPNVVVGINHDNYDWNHVRLASAASCTTNAVAPIMRLLDDKLGVERAHIETIHAYTSDQNLLDNFHRKPRRGRGAPLNMVITSTGAASAVARVIPALEGKLTGNAVRVPVPSGSLAIVNASVARPTNREALNEIVRQAALRGPLVEQILYSSSEEFVSSTVVGSTSTSVFDAPSTRVSADGTGVTVYAWYDNEYGYACQVMRLAKILAGVHRQRYI